MPPTKFTESNALLAVLSYEEEEAQRILESMTESELNALRLGAQRLSGMAHNVWAEKKGI